ncbi:MAG: type II secretion system F family protein [Nevskiaceae bacterium]|jgi:tight adherence protein B|nr:type II secretion system F family protein [Nevskiaceae bacterium]
MSWQPLVLIAAGAMIAVWAVALLTLRGARGYIRMQHRLADGDLASQFIFLDGRRLAAASAALGIAFALLAVLTRMPWPLAVLAFIAGLMSPRILTLWLQKTRRKRLYAQLPDALQTWAGLLGAGQGIGSSLLQLAARQPRPLGDELRVLVRESRMGVPVDASFDALCSRIGVRDLELMSTLLRITQELGGNLGESLLRLSTLLRSRQAAEARIRSLTSQGRLQGVIVGLLPVALLLVLCWMEPAAMSKLFTHPLGWLVLTVMGILEGVGFFFIRRIVAIDV